MIVKGAVDVLLNRTDWVEMKGETHEITEETRRVIEEQNQKYSREGLRVLAFAYKKYQMRRNLRWRMKII